MDFRATPLNVVALLLIAFAIWILYILSKRKMDSNLPLLFYGCLFAFLTYSGRTLPPYLFIGALSLALLLRFEFMNRAVTMVALVLEMLAVTAIAGRFFTDIFDVRLFDWRLLRL